MKTALQLLEEAKATIQDSKRWTQNAFARDKDNNKVSSRTPTAVCWCSLGALNRIQDTGGEYLKAVQLLTKAVQLLTKAVQLLTKAAGTEVAEYNDSSTHEEVLAMWDKAIELAKEEQNESARSPEGC